MAEQRDEGRGGGARGAGRTSTGEGARAEAAAAKEEVRNEVKDRAREAKAEAKDKGRELKARAREKGEELKERAREEGESRKAELSDRVRSVTAALEDAADTLDERGEGWLADQTRSAAERVEDLTRYLDDRDVEGLMGDLQDSARSHPGTFLGGSFAAGLALGRFLRASTPEPEPRSYEGTSQGLRASPPGRGRGQVGSGAPGTDVSRGYSGTEPEERAAGAPRRGSAGPEQPRTGRWSQGGGPERMNEPERPGTRTGGSAMASREAGSGRTTAGERSTTTGPNTEAGDRSSTEQGGGA